MDYNQLYQQYSAFTDPFGMRDEEEEDIVGNVKPVTQTIKTDPLTGEQTMTIKGSPQDLSAANPLTPTVSMPGFQPQPSQAGGFLGGYEDMAPAVPARPQMAAPQMAAPQAPMPATDNRNIVPLEQPTDGGYDPEQMAQVLQQAGLNYAPPKPLAMMAQAGMSDANPPAISQQPQPSQAGGFLGGYEDMAPAIPARPQMAAPAPQAAPAAPAPQAEPQAAPIESTEQTYTNRFYQAENNPAKMNELALDEKAPAWVRQMAVKSVELDVRQRRQEIDANRILRSGNGREIAREVGRDSDDGSIFKVLFYNAIGATKLSEQEQMKLGAGSTVQQVELADGRVAEVRTRLDGVAMYGSDLEGNPLSKKELKQAAEITQPPGSKPYGTTGYDAEGRVVERYQTPSGGITYAVVDPVTNRKKFTKTAPPGFSETKPEKGQITAVDQAKFFQTEKKRLQEENENEVKRSGPGARLTDDQLNSAAQASVANMVKIYSGDGRRPASPSQGGLATAGGSSAAAVNNPTGYGAKKQLDGSYTWDAYDTPQQGVAATQQAVGRYLNSEGVMRGVKPTPENVVGMWVNGKPGTGATEQGGRYAASVRRELAAAGVQLNSDGTIPNTPAANNAVTRAMIVHESGEQNAQKFLPFVGGQKSAATTTTPDTAATTTSETNIWSSTIKPEDRPPVRRPDQGDEAWKRENDLYTERQKLALKAQDTFATKLGEAVDKSASQEATIARVRQGLDNNPDFFGINNKSPAYKAFINAQTDEKKREALLNLGNQLKIPENKRSEFDATMQAIAQLQLNQITGSGLSAGQLNSDQEAARAVLPAGSINTDPKAMKAALIFKQAEIDYARAKADQFETAKTANPNINERAFNRVFDQEFGKKIFKDAQAEMEKTLKGGGTGGVTINDRGQPTYGGFTLTGTRRPE